MPSVMMPDKPHPVRAKPRGSRLVIAACTVAAIALACGGCESGRPQTTRLTADDILVGTNQVRERLAASPFVNERTPGDAPIRLAPGRVRNLSNDRLSKGDQLVVVRRVLADQGLQDLLRAKNVTVIMPPREAEAYAAELASMPEEYRAVAPTHAFRAEFRSLTRAGGSPAEGVSDVRRDYFLVDYSILELSTSRVTWTDTFEISRQATGILVD